MNLKVRLKLIIILSVFLLNLNALNIDSDVLDALNVDSDVVDESCKIESKEKKEKIKKKKKKINSKKEKENNKDKDKKQEENKDKDKKNKEKKEENNKEETNNKDKKEIYKKSPMLIPLGDSEIRAFCKFRMPEFFYGKNLRTLNNDNPTDRVLYFRQVIDLNVEYKFVNKEQSYDILFAKMNIRNKGIWGDPESIAFVSANTVKFLDLVVGEHSHAIPRNIFWMRELWVEFAINDLMHIGFENRHTLTVGLFPFELGRGISLGAAFTVDPTDLGFYAEAAIDQYAPGVKLSGTISKDYLAYDIYGSMLHNTSATYNQTNQNTRGQEFGHRNDQARGFGVINYLVAARLKWYPYNSPKCKLFFEPYALYNRNPDQKIEFVNDATITVISLGISSEARFGRIEWGFETAFNLGGQEIKGYDGNIIKPESREGVVVQVNSKIKQVAPGEPIPDCVKNPVACKKLPNALFTPENQKIIDVSEQAVNENCKIIGVNSLGILINDCTRFINPYVNRLKGYMFVFDLSYYILDPALKISGAIGFASGGPDPNKDLERFKDAHKDSDYDGFIGLQEVYSGTRVKSAFLLNGPAKIPRLLPFPSDDARHPYPTSVSRFTNIVYIGPSLDWRPKSSARKWSFNPNLLFYFQEYETRFYSKRIRDLKKIDCASSFLGAELNIFIESELLEGLKFFAIGAFYFPGQFYKDIKGLPINSAQQKYFDNKDKIGIVNPIVALIGDDVAYFSNIGLEYKF